MHKNRMRSHSPRLRIRSQSISRQARGADADHQRGSESPAADRHKGKPRHQAAVSLFTEGVAGAGFASAGLPSEGFSEGFSEEARGRESVT